MADLTVMQVNEEGFITLQYTIDGQHYYYTSIMPISMPFRDYSDVSNFGAVDFYEITNEEQIYIEEKLENKMQPTEEV